MRPFVLVRALFLRVHKGGTKNDKNNIRILNSSESGVDIYTLIFTYVIKVENSLQTCFKLYSPIFGKIEHHLQQAGHQGPKMVLSHNQSGWQTFSWIPPLWSITDNNRFQVQEYQRVWLKIDILMHPRKQLKRKVNSCDSSGKGGSKVQVRVAGICQRFCKVSARHRKGPPYRLGWALRIWVFPSPR